VEHPSAYYTLEEIYEILGFPPGEIQTAREFGWLTSITVEGKAYFSQVALLEYLQIKLELGSEIFRTEHESEFFDGFEMNDLLAGFPLE
jgi:hypothetical protein